eukprot:7276591-Prorocentrum_lima.AAC.1
MEPNPHLKVAQDLDETFQYYGWWYERKWDGLDARGHTGSTFLQYREHVRENASYGGLLELSAACSAYRLQAL